jgi:ElaB/YqjD/DUF883 family membrane-anchored ribosome-binding protein
MFDQQVENNVRQDAAKVNRDLITSVEDGISQLSEGFEKLTSEAKDTVINATAMVKKDVEHGLSQYNAKAQEMVDKVPGGFSEKAARYPWVTLSITLAVGFLLGNLLKPAR